MTIRFASAGTEECAVVASVLRLPRLTVAANDSEPVWTRDVLLRAALRHFATHGLAAAARARENAEAAFFADDRREYQHWIAICRALDRRTAQVALRQRAGQIGSAPQAIRNPR